MFITILQIYVTLCVLYGLFGAYCGWKEYKTPLAPVGFFFYFAVLTPVGLPKTIYLTIRDWYVKRKQ